MERWNDERCVQCAVLVFGMSYFYFMSQVSSLETEELLGCWLGYPISEPGTGTRNPEPGTDLHLDFLNFFFFFLKIIQRSEVGVGVLELIS